MRHSLRFLMVPILVAAMLATALLIGQSTSGRLIPGSAGASVTTEMSEPQAIWFTSFSWSTRLFGPFKSYYTGGKMA